MNNLERRVSDGVDDPIEYVEPDGVRTASGEIHRPDVSILATGFDG